LNTKIYKTDASGALTEEHGHPTNVRPLDLSITKSCWYFGIALFNVLFAGLANRIQNNKRTASGLVSLSH
jgi:F-type H+-transporting ATPase subunit a